MATEHEREVLKEFIEVYRENPCLWDVRSELYRNKGMKHEAWGLLTGILKKMDPNANVCTTKKKVDNLRSVYFRELKKVRASELRATDDEEIFQPNLWYFKLMGFLGSKEWGPRRATLDCTDPLQACPVQETTEDPEIPEVETDLEIPTPKKKIRKIQSSGRRKIEPESIRGQTFVKPLHYAEPRYMESKISETFGRVEQKAKSNSFGIYVGEQLEQISSFQRTVAEKLISEVLFLAKTGNLSCDSKIDSPKQNGPDIMLSSPIMVEVETENEKDGERILLKELLTEGEKPLSVARLGGDANSPLKSANNNFTDSSCSYEIVSVVPGTWFEDSYSAFKYTMFVYFEHLSRFSNYSVVGVTERIHRPEFTNIVFRGSVA